MPELFDVAAHYDDIQATDSYTSAPLFMVQTSTFMGASPDGSVSQKRIISTVPSITMPARRALTTLGENYIIGNGIVDGIYGQAIRRSFWTRLVTDTFTIRTPGQAALATGGVTAFGHKSHLKDVVDSTADSSYDPFWEIFFTLGEVVGKGSYFLVGGTYYRARSVHIDEAGFQNASSDELEAGARVAVVFNQIGAYNPVTDSFTGASVNTFGILLDRYKNYSLQTSADALNHAGDKTLTVAVSAVTPVVGRTVTIATVTYNILSSSAEQDAWNLHLRRA